MLCALLATPALAQERDFCANRPGLGTPPCTLAPGSAMIETGVAEWDHSADAASTDDSTTFGDLLLRVGVSQGAEVQFGLTSFTHDRVRNRATGVVVHSSNVGDALVAVRQGIAGPNGPVAIETFVSAPADHPGHWSAGVLLPASVDLPAGFQFALTPEIDLAADAGGGGRHLAYGGVLGLSHALAATVSVAGELAAFEDADPAGRSLDARLAASLAWQATPRLQLDVEADAGLSAGAPDTALMIGFAERFR
ncbi:MAG TPA: transporter [Croceibacterium sp.]|nr:transporter [Croceibacterium sp.]